MTNILNTVQLHGIVIQSGYIHPIFLPKERSIYTFMLSTSCNNQKKGSIKAKGEALHLHTVILCNAIDIDIAEYGLEKGEYVQVQGQLRYIQRYYKNISYKDAVIVVEGKSSYFLMPGNPWGRKGE